MIEQSPLLFLFIIKTKTLTLPGAHLTLSQLSSWIALSLFSPSQAGWKESHATFMTELRNLQATGLTTIGQSLRTAFDLLNLNRLVTGIDNYGQVCSTKQADRSLKKVMTKFLNSPNRPPFTYSQLPFPSPQSYKHQPPAYCDPTHFHDTDTTTKKDI